MSPTARSIELLAPAKTWHAGIAAINCGADAVYIGPERFGAREGAGNSVADIEKLCAYAHRYWARVYATVNTILRDDELAEAEQLIRQLYEAGIDGLIIQDMGLLELSLPPLPLIASTQMHNSSPEKAAFLEAVGFSRIILARELSLVQIRRIRLATRVELECFVHGALCVCYSGRCSLSYAIGGRSANRGECGQPCRKPYYLEDAHSTQLSGPAHFLSLRDLNLSDHLGELIDAGITAFKIEGRLKDTAYVVNTTSFYRKKIDALLAGKKSCKSSSGTVTFFFSPDLAKTFHRGFTTFFLKERPRSLATLKSPSWLGEYRGKVRGVGLQSFSLEHADMLHPGDGICFFDQHGRQRGSTVNRVDGSTVYPQSIEGITPGIAIYRNHDHWFLKALARRSAERRIAVRFELSESDKGFVLKVVDEDGISAAGTFTAEKKVAQKQDAARATIIKQLHKLGSTIFFCTGVRIRTGSIYFIPVAQLNNMRREVLAALEIARAQNRPVQSSAPRYDGALYPVRELSYADNVLNEKARIFYQRHGVVRIEPAAESGLAMQGRSVMTTKYCIRYELGWCHKERKTSVHDPLYLVDFEGRRFRLVFDCVSCQMEVVFIP